MNIRFEYLYRDSGNYKNWGDVVFSNKNNISVELLSSLFRELFESGIYFNAAAINVQDLHFSEYNPTTDHSFHEFHKLTNTSDIITDPMKRDITSILKGLCDKTKSKSVYN